MNGRWLALAVVFGASFLLVAPPWAGVSHDRSITSVASATSYPTTGTSPPPTSYAAATFDAADGYVLMFGGNDVTGNPISTTWTFVHNNWTNLTSSIGPSPSARWASAMAYDPANSTVVLFGGCLNPSCSELTDDTWTYAHDRWTNLTGSLAVAPPPRGRAMMSYDAGEGRVLLFGGIGAGGVYLNDLWGFKDGRWTPISTQAAPSTRGGAMFAYDPASNSTILFGGNDGPYRFGDTWSYSNGTWTNVTPTVGPGPSPRWVGEMTYDGTDGYLLLVNGYNSGTYFGDEWTFANGKWASLSVSGGPTASYGGLLVYDPVDRYVVYFSGVASGGVLTSTLIYSGGSWTLLINPPGSNPALLFLVFFALFILVPVTFALLVGTFVQRRRERRLGEGFVLPPSEKVEWVPAGPALERQRRLRWAASLGLTLFLVLILVVPLLLTTGGSGVFLLLFELPLLLVLIAVFAFAQRGQETRAVAAARSGVILQRRRGDLRVPWGQLQPGLIRPVREMYSFQYLLPGHQAGVAGFQVTVDQARAILRSPYAPAWVLTPSVTSGLGLPVPQPWGASPPPAANPSPGGFGLPPPPLSGSSPFASSPPPQPPSVSPWTPPSTPPWTPPPPPRSPRPSVPVGPPAGTIPCPRCGQFNPIGRVVFCQSCGQRLP